MGGYLARMTDSNPHPSATIETNHGTFTVELWEDVAPNHAENFLELARNKFYDGVVFHRIIPGFMIQGGCPDGTGTGGSGHHLQAEFNDREHQPGVLSMARSADPNSASSQFFVCLTREHCRHLDGEYTAFGKVVDGMDVVEKIAAIDVDPSGRAMGDMPTMTAVRPVE